MKRNAWYQVKYEVAFDVVHCYPLQISNWLDLSINLKLNEEVEDETDEEEELEANLASILNGILYGVWSSKCCQPTVEIGGYQTQHHVQQVLDNVQVTLLADNYHICPWAPFTLAVVLFLKLIRILVCLLNAHNQICLVEVAWLDSINLGVIRSDEVLLEFDLLQLVFEI